MFLGFAPQVTHKLQRGQGPGLIPFYITIFPIFPSLLPFSICFGIWYKTGAKQTHAEEMEVERVKVFL